MAGSTTGFNVPGSLNGQGATPYVIQTIHQNGINQETYVVNNPDFYNPNATTVPEQGGSSSRLTFYNIDPHFHAALNMQGGVGVDRQVGKVTLNATYLYTRGIHQYPTDNVTAPSSIPRRTPLRERCRMFTTISSSRVAFTASSR